MPSQGRAGWKNLNERIGHWRGFYFVTSKYIQDLEKNYSTDWPIIYSEKMFKWRIGYIKLPFLATWLIKEYWLIS